MKLCLLSITASHNRQRIYQLIDSSFDCRFIFGKDNSTVKRLDYSFFKDVKELPNIKIGNSKWYYQPQIMASTKKYDIIIDDLGAFCLSSWMLHIIKFFRGQKVYCWDHGWYGRENFIRKWIKRLYFGLVDGTFIYGNYARDLMIKNGFNGRKLHVIHNSLDYDHQLEIRKQVKYTGVFEKHFGNLNPVLCFIGRLTPVKKLDQIIDALSILKDRGKKCNLVLIGEGSEYKHILDKVENLNLLKNVWFYGACYDEMVNAELIYNADLCVAPGNIGLTAMHAMMFGCPCISHNVFPWQMPEFEAIVPYKTGNFFERNNANSLADVIQEWFEINNSSREQIRNNCYKEIDENWNPHKQIEIIKEVIYG